jgi:hypothetical protein
MAKTVEPWGFYRGADELVRFAPGVVAAMRNEDRREQAREQQARAEARDLTDERRERWALSRMQRLAFEGKPFDPGDWRTLVEPEEALIARTWASIDAEDARMERRVLVDAGMLHLLGPEYIPAPPAQAETPTASLSPIQSRARRALRRFSSDKRSQARKAVEAKEYGR